MSIQNTDEVVEAQKGKPRAVLYFQRDHTQIAKELAGALRAQNKLANMVYASLFNGPEDCESCEAVAIQHDAPKVHLIAKSYKQTFPNTELHFFNDKGDFVDGPNLEDTGRFEMPSLNKPKSEPVEPAPPTEEEREAAKAALLASMEPENETDETTTDPAPAEPSDLAGQDAAETDDSEETESSDDAESETGDDGGDGTTKS